LSQVLKPRKGYKIVTNFFRRETEIPKDWDYPKFHEVVKTNPVTKIDGKNIPYIPMDSVDVERPHFRYFEERKLSDNPSLPKFQENDVLFARITPSTENGKTCIIENFNQKGIASSELTILRSSNKVLPKYLYYYVKRYKIRQFAISQMLGTTGRQRVPDYVFKKDLNFELPSLDEQQKIISILSNIDNLIISTKKLIDQTILIKKGQMQKLFTKGIDHKKFKKIKWLYGKEIETPEEWKITELQHHAELYVPMRDKPKKFDGNIPWLRIEDLDEKYASDSKSNQRVSLETIKEMKLRVYPIGTVLCSCSATIGICAITTQKLTTNQTFIGITPNDSLDNQFLYYFLTTQKNYLNSVGSGSTILYISRKKFEKMKIVLPPLQEQQKIVTILSNVDSQIISQTQYKEKLERLKKSLMQKLLTGQVRVVV